jgi:nucleoside-diphosphate-sugar epimerase
VIRDGWKHIAEYRKVNVEGTRNVIRAAIYSGVKTFIHFSSIKAMGESSDRILTETDRCEPETPYGLSKLESEAVVREETATAGIRGVILRLPMVYGPGNKGNILRLLRLADRGYPLPIFPPVSLRSMIYVGNVAASVTAVLKSVPVLDGSCST